MGATCASTSSGARGFKACWRALTAGDPVQRGFSRPRYLAGRVRTFGVGEDRCEAEGRAIPIRPTLWLDRGQDRRVEGREPISRQALREAASPSWHTSSRPSNKLDSVLILLSRQLVKMASLAVVSWGFAGPVDVAHFLGAVASHATSGFGFALRRDELAHVHQLPLTVLTQRLDEA